MSGYRIDTACVIGAGTMGLGIAGQLANAGVDVLLLDLPSPGEDRNAHGRRALERLMDPRQPGLLHPDLARHITIGNIDDDLEHIAGADWIAEAVVERLDVKRGLYRRVDAHRKPGSIVSSNTSTIPISLLVEGMPDSFRAEFAITHFFNPVRFMRLLELVRGEHTREAVIEALDAFCDQRLGKGVVRCADTPGFLGNRVGVFAIQAALHAAFRLGLQPEQADAIFGRPMGIPKTGVFGLYDLIGIDLMGDVVASLVAILPPDDPFHAVAGEIPLMRRMIRDGRIGNKAGAGFYRYRDPVDRGSREALDLASGEYRGFDRERPSVALEAERGGDPALLLDAAGVTGDFAREVLCSTLAYAARLVPEVSESPVAIDDAMKLGYNWARGPFELVDQIGAGRIIDWLESERRQVPPFLRELAAKPAYRVHAGRLGVLSGDGEYRQLQRAPGVLRFSEQRRCLEPLIDDPAASYFGLGDRLGLVEFHSKANTLDGASMRVLAEGLAHARAHLDGLIIHNDEPHFSCGVNLEAVLAYIDAGDWPGLDAFLADFQNTVAALQAAPLPVVAAPAGLSLGGGFEVVLHCDAVVFHANSVTGLVESLVGLVPSGGGVTETLRRWYARTGDIEQAAWQAFKTIGYGRTAASPLEAEPLAMFREGVDDWLMNRDRLLDAAMRKARQLAGRYTPPAWEPLPAAGPTVHAAMCDWLARARDDGKLTAHDVTTGAQIARIVTGGGADAGARLGRRDWFALERGAFLALARTAETRARIAHMLDFGTPLRN